MMLRIIAAVAVLQLMAWSPAWAQQVCAGQPGGQPGTSIFKTTFADDSDGWDESPPMAVVKPPVFVFALDATTTGTSANNLTFNATDGDYCMDVVLPPSIAPNNLMYAGINFWAAVDYSSMLNVELASNGAVLLEKYAAKKWSAIFNVPNAPGFNSAANAVNTLRLTSLAGTLTVYLNGNLVKAVRTQQPTGVSFFGMSANDDIAVANAPAIKIQSFSVTTGK
jgi:hypothetical protein